MAGRNQGDGKAEAVSDSSQATTVAKDGERPRLKSGGRSWRAAETSGPMSVWRNSGVGERLAP